MPDAVAIADVLGVSESVVGSRLYSTSLLQHVRAIRYVARFRRWSPAVQEEALRRIGSAIATGDVAAARHREAGNRVALRSVIRQRDYWIEVAYRILAHAEGAWAKEARLCNFVPVVQPAA